MRLITGLIILSLACLSCNSKEAKPANKSKSTSQLSLVKPEKPLIKLENLVSNNGYINLLFNIVEQGSQDGYFLNKIQGLYNNDTLELIIGLKEGLPAGVGGAPEDGLVMDGIIFESTGPKSDRLLTALAQKYKINSESLVMKSKQVFACSNLNQAAIDYQSGTPTFKIFLSGENEGAELYVKFDFKKSTIFLNEKDLKYRNSLITILSK